MCVTSHANFFFFFFQAEDGIRDKLVTGVQTCALPIFAGFAHGLRDGGVLDRVAVPQAVGEARERPGHAARGLAAGDERRSEERRVWKEGRYWRSLASFLETTSQKAFALASNTFWDL